MREPMIYGATGFLARAPEAATFASSMKFEKDMIQAGGNMNHDELDRILSKQDDIQPSSGFTASVMVAVREEASAPPPIPFPWTRALPVLVFAALALIAVAVAGVAAIAQMGRGEASMPVASSVGSMLPMQARSLAGTEVAWSVVALLVTFVSVKVSMRLAAGRT